MTTRRPIVGGNWKMNTNRASAVALADALRSALAGTPAEVVVYPPFPYLLEVGRALHGSEIALGAQDAWFEPDGAFTGEVSTAMLLDCGCRWLLVGHSERRHVIGEADELINRKVQAGLDAGLSITLCVGETLQQREAGQTDAINASQLRAGLAGVPESALGRVVIAYEPVWAIGTGRTAGTQDAQAAHEALRSVLHSMYSEAAAASMRIQYGGSVKPDNAAALFACPDIDGGLIGGASLKAADFSSIVRAIHAG